MPPRRLSAPKKMRKLYLGMVLVLAIMIVVGGVLIFPQNPGVDTKALVMSPARNTVLAAQSWKLETSNGSDSGVTEVWTALAPGKRRITYFQEIYRGRNELVARWDYLSSVRRNFERNYPSKVIGVNGEIKFGADEKDTFCVDIDDTLSKGIDSCAMWIFWARYGQFRIYISVNGTHLGREDFLRTVGEVDAWVLDALE
ncbi:hypothetical protein [Catellatospora sichuanensis]|uniref:hypothetical protein n=1 Tax=Catellatospora sichuanensis TaxID=1969805 RepID=UPI00118269DF|nr:hypothetical protein [Catellatospora sichuanensis]